MKDLNSDYSLSTDPASLLCMKIIKSIGFCSALGMPKGAEIKLSLLGAGEYNINYLFSHPLTGEKLVLRIPMGSQMGIKNQARYEYEALKLLEPSKRTPTPIFAYDADKLAPLGYMVMSYLSGEALQYERDMKIAAKILSDIHNIKPFEDSHLICPKSPLEAILHESNTMAKIYLDYNKGGKNSKSLLKEMLKLGEGMACKSRDYGHRVIINTELNSGNFLINGSDKENYLIDWEKPLFAYAFQDLGHFLAPTTTFWKTDIMLAKKQIDIFLLDYSNNSSRYKDFDRLMESTMPYLTMTCLRGISWCAMAWVQYEAGHKALKNQLAYEKIKKYLSTEFLELIRNEYLYG